MILRFDPNQKYQLDAVDTVVKLFEGQSLSQGDYLIRDETCGGGVEGGLRRKK